MTRNIPPIRAWLWHSCQASIADQVRVQFGDLTEIEHADGFRISGGDIRRKLAQPFRQLTVGTEGPVLFRRQRGHVHRIQRYRVLQIFDDLLGNSHSDNRLRFLGGSADVRRADPGRHSGSASPGGSISGIRIGADCGFGSG